MNQGEAAKGIWGAVKKLAAIEALMSEVSERIPQEIAGIREQIMSVEDRMEHRVETTRVSLEQRDSEVESRLVEQVRDLRNEVQALSKEIRDLNRAVGVLAGRDLRGKSDDPLVLEAP